MAVYLLHVRFRNGQFHPQDAVDNDCILVGKWNLKLNGSTLIKKIHPRSGESEYRAFSRCLPKNRTPAAAAQLYRFIHEIRRHDIVLLPGKHFDFYLGTNIDIVHYRRRDSIFVRKIVWLDQGQAFLRTICTPKLQLRMEQRATCAELTGALADEVRALAKAAPCENTPPFPDLAGC